MNKVIVICGQTSTGKSDFAVKIAKKIGGEIVSADSRQVYIGLDLGTGKITKEEMKGVPHHLLDVASPRTIFTVSKYKKLADKKIKEIIKRGNIPIICGGSGFYIDAIINDSVFPNVKPNKKLRKELSLKSKEELFKILKKLDKNRAETIDKNNPVRLIRAIEIATSLGSVPTVSHKSDLGQALSPMCSYYDVLKIGLTLPDEILKERIYKRILKRIKFGMIDEVQALHDKGRPAGRQGLSWAKMYDLGLEYRYISQYLQEENLRKNGPYAKKNDESQSSLKLRRANMIDKLNTETWHYAKRQKTWFKRDKNTIWLDPRNKKEVTNILKQVKEFLK